MLPPAVQDFLDLSSDPDLDGYQADTSINTNDSNDSTCSSTPVMTLSDDFLLDPDNWTSDPLRARLMRLRDLLQQESTPTKPTPILPVDDLSSVTELESKPEIAAPMPILPVNDPSSMTEPESEPDNPPQPTIPTPTLPIDDPSSVTEPESKPKNPPQPEFTTLIKIKGATPVLKKKGFFDTPSPPGPDSLYWKYVSCEEDEKWYDRSKTDSSFHAVHSMKQQLKDIS
ncbi:uncharacterized protein BJ212DRAFT_1480022 [Suillus subaureus]|uniref:Uncharacterized protein n=1 Tax=Suillus subaureus TaxID=48587 RepID=A0A9P7EDK1_9AGAM|nr:uncharacterized protein BJ212DRAFT_1480022 [Suillus subaureus]KAG1818204.1 hypothetical protein BJ212DRAFT_1480022 [Suillus subaureus]